jgi:hypothetical protein
MLRREDDSKRLGFRLAVRIYGHVASFLVDARVQCLRKTAHRSLALLWRSAEPSNFTPHEAHQEITGSRHVFVEQKGKGHNGIKPHRPSGADLSFAPAAASSLFLPVASHCHDGSSSAEMYTPASSTLKPAEVAVYFVEAAVEKHRTRLDKIFFKAVRDVFLVFVLPRAHFCAVPRWCHAFFRWSSIGDHPRRLTRPHRVESRHRQDSRRLCLPRRPRNVRPTLVY